MVGSIYQVLEQFFSRKSTNTFPVKYAPKSVTEALKGAITPPIPTTEGFRGKLTFDYEKCIGCAMCEKVCPAAAIELYPVMAKEKKSKRIVIHLARCTFCSECVHVCPKDAIGMTEEFMMADFDRNGDSMIIGSQERRDNELTEEEPATS